eukprot:g1816.t1
MTASFAAHRLFEKIHDQAFSFTSDYFKKTRKCSEICSNFKEKVLPQLALIVDIEKEEKEALRQIWIEETAKGENFKDSIKEKTYTTGKLEKSIKAEYTYLHEMKGRFVQRAMGALRIRDQQEEQKDGSELCLDSAIDSKENRTMNAEVVDIDTEWMRLETNEELCKSLSEELRGEFYQLQEEVSSKVESLDNLKSSLAVATQDMKDIISKKKLTDSKVSSLWVQIVEKNKQISELENELAMMQDTMQSMEDFVIRHEKYVESIAKLQPYMKHTLMSIVFLVISLSAAPPDERKKELATFSETVQSKCNSESKNESKSDFTLHDILFVPHLDEDIEQVNISSYQSTMDFLVELLVDRKKWLAHNLYRNSHLFGSAVILDLLIQFNCSRKFVILDPHSVFVIWFKKCFDVIDDIPEFMNVNREDFFTHFQNHLNSTTGNNLVIVFHGREFDMDRFSKLSSFLQNPHILQRMREKRLFLLFQNCDAKILSKDHISTWFYNYITVNFQLPENTIPSYTSDTLLSRYLNPRKHMQLTRSLHDLHQYRINVRRARDNILSVVSEKRVQILPTSFDKSVLREVSGVFRKDISPLFKYESEERMKVQHGLKGVKQVNTNLFSTVNPYSHLLSALFEFHNYFVSNITGEDFGLVEDLSSFLTTPRRCLDFLLRKVSDEDSNTSDDQNNDEIRGHETDISSFISEIIHSLPPRHRSLLRQVLRNKNKNDMTTGNTTTEISNDDEKESEFSLVEGFHFINKMINDSRTVESPMSRKIGICMVDKKSSNTEIFRQLLSESQYPIRWFHLSRNPKDTLTSYDFQHTLESKQGVYMHINKNNIEAITNLCKTFQNDIQNQVKLRKRNRGTMVQKKKRNSLSQMDDTTDVSQNRPVIFLSVNIQDAKELLQKMDANAIHYVAVCTKFE